MNVCPLLIVRSPRTMTNADRESAVVVNQSLFVKLETV
jgi:hypothetical protein